MLKVTVQKNSESVPPPIKQYSVADMKEEPGLYACDPSHASDYHNVRVISLKKGVLIFANKAYADIAPLDTSNGAWSNIKFIKTDEPLTLTFENK